MDINNYVEEFLINKNETATILAIYNTGSQIFIDTPSDLDYTIVCSGLKQKVYKTIVEYNGIMYDLFIKDETMIPQMLDFANSDYMNLKVFNYFLAIEVPIYGEFKHGWNIFEHETEYKNYIKNKYNSEVVLRSKKNPKSNARFFVHYYIILKIFDSGSLIITNEMRDNVSLMYQNSEEAYPAIDWVMANI